MENNNVQLILFDIFLVCLMLLQLVEKQLKLLSVETEEIMK